MTYYNCKVGLIPTPAPAPASYLYNWDFTESLVDSAQGATMTLFVPESGQSTVIRDSRGIVDNDSGDYYSYAVTIPDDVDLFQPGYEVEIDIGDLDLHTYAMGLCEFFRYIADDYSISDGPAFVWDEESEEYGVRSFYSYETICSTSNINYFANCTLKIVTSEVDNTTVWSIYKDNVLLCSTPSGIQQSSEKPFWAYYEQDPEEPESIINPRWIVGSQAPGTIIIRGLRIKQTSTPPSEWTYDWDFTQSLVDSVQGATIVTGSDVSTSGGLTYTYESVGVTDDYLCQIPVDFLSPNKQVEIDFGTCSWDAYAASTNPLYIGWYSPNSTAPIFSGISYNTDEGAICAGVTETNLYDPIASPGSENIFSGTTLRIVTSMSGNNNLQWSVYTVANGEATLLGETADSDVLTYDTEEYQPTSSDVWGIAVCGNDNSSYPLVVTGLRIKDVTV